MNLSLRQAHEPGSVRLTLLRGSDEIASYSLDLPAHDGDVAEAVDRIATDAEEHGVHLRGHKRQALFRAIAMGTPI